VTAGTEAVVPEERDIATRAYRGRLSRWLLIAAAVLAVGLGWTDVVSSTPSSACSLEAFPRFSLASLDGTTIDDTALQGHVTVVNVWASWCPPCRSEAPVLREVAQDTEADGVRFLGVLYQDQEAPARAFAERVGMTFPTLLEGDALARSLGVRAVPTTFVVDAEGRIRARHFGPITEAQLRVLIEDAAHPFDASVAPEAR